MSQTVAQRPPAAKPTGEQQTRQSKPGFNLDTLLSQRHVNDLIFGQPVIVTMRWILISSGLLLAIWNVDSVVSLRVQVLAILLLAVANFYLQAQLMMKKPVVDLVVYGASAVDLLLITVLVLFQGGFESSMYIFYFPAIAAFAVAFPRLLTYLYVFVVMGVYGLIGLFDGDISVLFARLVMIAAVGICGSLYLSMERSRREAAAVAQQQLRAEIEERRRAAA
jgi:signal transduction histidine kinase